MKLIVGLGNPGDKYARNRHNVGFLAVDRIAERHRFPAWRRRFQALTTEATIGGERVVLLKPDTYMNESGRSVGEAARFLKIGLGDVVVLHDELDLVPGKLKVKVGGGLAGNNGLKSIKAHLHTDDFVRVRLGIGKPPGRQEGVDHVLRRPGKAEQAELDVVVAEAADAVELILVEGAEAAMTRFNQRA